jgi:alkylhydroperoxidase/carboxymuconolactone decarboxylase family protein YurZ
VGSEATRELRDRLLRARLPEEQGLMPPTPTARKLAVSLSADVVGYSRLTPDVTPWSGSSSNGQEASMEAHLDPKTQLLVALGAAAAARCQTCFAGLYPTACKVEASDREIRAAVAIATKVAAKSQDFMAAFIEETTEGAISAGAVEAETTGCG